MNGVPQLRPQFPDYGNVLARGAAIKGAESRNILTQMQMQDYPEERNWLRKQRGFVEEDRALAAEKLKRDLKDRLKRMNREDIEWERKGIKDGADALAQVNSVADYTAFYPYAIAPDGLSLNPELLEDPSAFIRADGTPDEEAFKQYRISKVRDAKSMIKEYEAFTFPAKPTYDHQTIYGPKGQTKRVAIKKGEEYTPPEGWTLKTPVKESDEGKYTIPQRIDDARSFYTFKMRTLLDDFGAVKEGKEKEYDGLTDALAKDEKAIRQGKEPSYLKEKQKEVVRTGTHKGRKVVQYADGSVEYTD